jgi:hypothetical protein
MSLIAMQGGATGTGTVTLLAPITNSDRTLTLPDATGTVLSTATAGVPVNGPAFSASNSTTQSISTATFTKVTLDTEAYDTNSNFASSRFTPTVAGYYQVIASVRDGTGGATGQFISNIYKNGAVLNQNIVACAGAVGITSVCSAIVYMNGSTDYLEQYVYQASGSAMNISASGNTTYFQAAMIRSAV